LRWIIGAWSPSLRGASAPSGRAPPTPGGLCCGDTARCDRELRHGRKRDDIDDDGGYQHGDQFYRCASVLDSGVHDHPASAVLDDHPRLDVIGRDHDLLVHNLFDFDLALAHDGARHDDGASRSRRSRRLRGRAAVGHKHVDAATVPGVHVDESASPRSRRRLGGEAVTGTGSDEHTATPTLSVDALLPRAMARKAEDIGVAKAALSFGTLAMLAVLAGAFISFGALFSTVITADTTLAPGLSRLLGGLVFSLGLVLVVVGGAELFTGNALIVMAVASRRVRLRSLLRNWIVVFGGNLVGASATAMLVVSSGRLDAGGGAFGQRAMAIAEAKVSLRFSEALTSGILANVLVCLAVWLSFSARSVTDRIAAVILPVSAFVAVGFEHSIANMYFIPVALFHRRWAVHKATLPSSGHLSWTTFFGRNLLPVTIGNILGGAVLVGGVYWAVYLRDDRRTVQASPPQTSTGKAANE
jgi:formate transporter